MKDIIRDAWLGQGIRLIFNNKFLLYPEEEDSFQWPLPVQIASDVIHKEHELTV